MTFYDRVEAGQKLASALKKYRNQKDIIILALPRGGVVTGFEAARILNLPLDLVVPRKIGAPGNPEFAIGAITEKGEGIFNQEAIAAYGITKEYIDSEVEKERKEAERRLKLYRGKRAPLDLKDKTVILIDDGIATGMTIKAAIQSIKGRNPKKIVIAVPVAPEDTISELKVIVDEVICLYTPVFFGAVGAFYEIFNQTEDEEVIELMEKSKDFGNL